jgi:hypothetical protein
MARPYTTSRFFHSTSRIILLSILLRLLLIAYGIYHDAHSPLKYTDVDYYVFTDAAQFMHQGKSPYLRETYRYTPILAWMLIPTAWPGCFSWGKLMFALGDVAAGWIMILILRQRGMNHARSLKYASIWLLNPMVQQTRSSCSYCVGCSYFDEGELRRLARIYDLSLDILDSTRSTIMDRLTPWFCRTLQDLSLHLYALHPPRSRHSIRPHRLSPLQSESLRRSPDNHLQRPPLPTHQQKSNSALRWSGNWIPRSIAMDV